MSTRGSKSPRVKVAQLAREAVAVGDLYVLVGAGVHHHVPGIAIQPICPVIVTLGQEVGIGQEELLQEVEQGEDGSQLVAQPGLRASFAPGPLIHTGSTRPRSGFGGQQLLQPFRASGYQLPRPFS